MPKRPIQHVVADQGVSEVVRILSTAGWACEPVKADYGEDLICQTAHKGLVDPHRIMVQVKSTNRPISRRGARISVSKNTLIKWLSDSNVVLVCVWFASMNVCLYQMPSDHFDLFEVDLTGKKIFDLRFPTENVLDKNAAEAIAWRARIRNINRHFLETKNFLDNLDPRLFDSDEQYNKDRTELEGNLVFIATKFLTYLDLVRQRGAQIIVDTRALIHELLYLGAAAPRKEGLSSLKMNFNEILVTMLLLRARRVMPAGGVPPALLEVSLRYYAECLVHTIQTQDPLSPKRALTRKQIERLISSIAHRLWTHGAKFTEEEIVALIKDDRVLDEASAKAASQIGKSAKKARGRPQ